jgi:predicted nuclease of restriction endonuclease-like (RecB) superfamily
MECGRVNSAGKHRSFQRLALSKNKDEILHLSAQGQIISKTNDIIRDPYIFEFLKIPEGQLPSELENLLCNNLQQFLLELGKGFTRFGVPIRGQTIPHDHQQQALQSRFSLLWQRPTVIVFYAVLY